MTDTTASLLENNCNSQIAKKTVEHAHLYIHAYLSKDAGVTQELY